MKNRPARQTEFQRLLVRWLLLASFAVGLGGLNVAPAQAHALVAPRVTRGLDVQPFPGTPDASPQTDVGFPALAPAQIRALTVTGSRSGIHTGRLIALPGGGSAFLPTKRFAPGERVSVRATLSSPAAGAASGVRGATRLRFSFGVAVPAGNALTDTTGAGWPSAPLAHAAVVDPGGRTHSFYSENWLHPPIAFVSGTDRDPGQGDIFGDAENSLQPGPLILNPQGQLIYFQPLRQSAAFNVMVQQYQGQSVLTYFQGYVTRAGIGVGRDVILNHQYQQVAIVHAGHGYSADLHEFQITPQGDALISAYAPVKANLSSVGGPRNGILMDSIIQEIDIATGQVLWEWHASGHVDLTSSHFPVRSGVPWDFFHINSIQLLPGNKLLISARHTWSLYEIDMTTGRITLVIGGKHSFFKMGPGANFEWQHDAALQPDGTITLFDDASDGPVSNEGQSRGLRIWLDYKHHRATLVRAYLSNPALLSGSQGSVQPLPDGNTFVGWGSNAYFTEFSRTGALMFNVHLAAPIGSYRGYRFQWWGQPTTPPSLAVVPTPRGTRVYASWNGATTVQSWRVLAGPSTTSLTPLAQFPKSFFETKMWVPSSATYFAVEALGSDGQVLGTSAAVRR